MAKIEHTAQATPKSRISGDRLVKLLIGFAVLLVAAWVGWRFSGLVIFLTVGALFAYALGPISDRLQRAGLTRTSSVLVTFIIIIVGLGFVGVSMVPFVRQQANELTGLFSPERIRLVAISIESFLRSYIPIPEGSIIEGLEGVFTALFRQERITGAVSYLVNLFTNILYAVIVIPLITFFIMKDGRQLSDSILRLVPNRYFEITVNLLGTVETYIGRYFWALLIRTIVVAVLSTLLLAVVGLKYAVIVGIFTGLANTIPYFGPLIGMIAGMIVGIAQTGDFSLVPGVFVAMAITQVVDNILQPLVFSRAARMHPLVILCAVLIGAEMAGIIGMLLAIPVLTVVWVTIRQATWSLKNYHVFRTA